MKDEQYTLAIGAWLKGREVVAPDSRETASQVSARLPGVPQRSRWWPLPRVRQAAPPSDTDHSDRQAARPIPATSGGPTPIVIGRTRTMLIPVKAIVAGAFVFAIGGALLIAQPFDQRSSSPGAEIGAELPMPAAFTSTYVFSRMPTSGQPQAHDNGVEVMTGEAWQFRNVEATDPRFAGTMTVTSTRIAYPDEVDLLVGAYRIEDADGAWQETAGSSLQLPGEVNLWRTGALPEAGSSRWRTFVGEGDYEGHWAVVEETWRPDGGSGVAADILLDGFVFEGAAPQAPEPWSAE